MMFKERNQSAENEKKENYSKAENQKILSHKEKMFPDFNNCSTKKLETKFVQHSNYWVLQNYIKASETFLCNATITYTTLGELGYLHNLAEIATRWQILNSEELLKYKVNCARNLKDLDVSNGYRFFNGIFFPINIARNIAWQNAATYFVFPSDIELYPSVNVIPEFLKLLERRDVSNTTNKRVFVLPVFELEENEVPPKYKEELLFLLLMKKAHIFHKNICRPCHEVPSYDHRDLAKECLTILTIILIGFISQHFKTF
ncbi:Glycosyltransferase-like protein LARGE2 [Armadillidium nasatum]|uniref:Glycosyltransferase-like protein LARGE2 n=1 Tax=Armadillidium nasatum TaxID=96803 RepID=A0A5N5TDP8_9CRUS|nr:Glycosyltransferase-like protein LARGE2 [Armadillidium nasatum]